MLIHQYESNSSKGKAINSIATTTTITTNESSNNSPSKPLAVDGNIMGVPEMIYERGGILRSYSYDIHMNSLSKVWNPPTLNVGYTGFDPYLSSFQLVDNSLIPTHLIILQHGFQGSGFDMRLIRNALHVEFPHYLVIFPYNKYSYQLFSFMT